MADIHDHLRRWVDAGVIDEATAGRIRDFETGPTRPVAGPDADVPRPSLVEALLYLGIAVVLVGVLLLIGPAWGDLTSAARVGIVAVPAVLALAGGWAMRATGDDRFVRGGDMMWLAAMVLVTVTVAIIVNEADVEGGTSLLLTGVTALATALLLWTLAPSYPQILGLGGAIFFFAQAIGAWPDEYSTLFIGMVLAGAGAAGIVLTELGMVRPLPGAVVVFAGLLAFGAFFAGLDDSLIWVELGAFAVAAVLMALSLWRGRFVYLLAGVGLAFVQLVAFIFEYFQDAIGAPLALIISGAILIAAVLMLIPMRRIVRRKPLVV